jgi:hypothetical protein
MVKAQIENGIVVNIIMIDPNNIPDWCADWPTLTAGGIGWLYDEATGQFTDPNPTLEITDSGEEVNPPAA